jgi:uncharacterized protein
VFEWDENKRAANLAKNAIDFVRAARIFQNPALEKTDDREDYSEKRPIAIGYWETDFVVVVSTWRGENRRIISAWKAGADEQQFHTQAFAGRDHED